MPAPLPILRHTHTWVRADRPDGRKDYNTYKCDHPDCGARATRIELKGKRSLCTKCLGEIILKGELLRVSRPLCDACSNRKEAKLKKTLLSGLTELGIE